MIRLKYNKSSNYLITEWFTIGPNLIVRGCIDTETYYYFISEFDTNILVEGNAKDLRQAKSMIKKKLVEVGVNFDGEIRNK